MTRPMSKERLLDLWQEAVKGLGASNDDVLDLIQEVVFLRDTYNLPSPDLPIPKKAEPQTSTLSPDPWAEEWPGNP